MVGILSAQINSTSFSPKIDFTSGDGTGVGRQATGDFNNDGKPDIVVANISANTISIFKNTSSVGKISFANKMDMPVSGNGPESIATGDFDSDGKLDFVVSNGGNSSTIVEIFKNTSKDTNITFSKSLTITVGTAPKGIVAKDFDGDGKLDIASTNFASNSISVLRNTSSGGSITFNLKQDYSVGNSPILLVTNDFDGDGKYDLACSNYITNGTVTVLRNLSTSGTILFSNWGSLISGSFPNFIGSTDLDGDQRPELFNVNFWSYNFNIYRNISTSGLIGFENEVSFTTGTSSTQPQGIAASDFDGDGKKDIVTTNSKGGYISVFRNTCSPGIFNANSFASAVTFNATPTNNYGIEAIDFDSDNKIDILITNSDSGTFSIYQNQSPKTNINSVIPTKKSITVYPLPMKDILNIETNNGENIVSVTILDLFGHEVITAEEFTIDVSTLKGGAYLAKITSDRNVYYQKITK